MDTEWDLDSLTDIPATEVITPVMDMVDIMIPGVEMVDIIPVMEVHTGVDIITDTTMGITTGTMVMLPNIGMGILTTGTPTDMLQQPTPHMEAPRDPTTMIHETGVAQVHHSQQLVQHARMHP